MKGPDTLPLAAVHEVDYPSKTEGDKALLLVNTEEFYSIGCIQMFDRYGIVVYPGETTNLQTRIGYLAYHPTQFQAWYMARRGIEIWTNLTLDRLYPHDSPAFREERLQQLFKDEAELVKRAESLVQAGTWFDVEWLVRELAHFRINP